MALQSVSKSASLGTGHGPASLASILDMQGSELSLSAGHWMTSRSPVHSIRTSCICRFWPIQWMKMPMCSVFSLCSPWRSRTGQLRPPLLVCLLIPAPRPCPRDRVGPVVSLRHLLFPGSHLCLCHSDSFYWTQIPELMTLP